MTAIKKQSTAYRVKSRALNTIGIILFIAGIILGADENLYQKEEPQFWTQLAGCSGCLLTAYLLFQLRDYYEEQILNK